MDIPQKQLNHWWKIFDSFHMCIRDLAKAVQTGQREAAFGLITEMEMATIGMVIDLEQAGAEHPVELPYQPSPAPDQLDTPANRRYAAALRKAWECAREVDRERGCEKDGPATVLFDILTDVEMEIHSAKGYESGKVGT
jgi:hypothetical protein